MNTYLYDSTPARPSIPADEIRNVNMGVIWGAVFMIVVVLLGIMDPIQAVAHLIENEGLGEGGATVLGVIAGYTFPLTVGFALIMFYLLSGRKVSDDGPKNLVAAAAVLWVSGLLANTLGLGLSPSYGTVPSAPFWLAFPLYVAAGYLSSYGLTLSFCAFLIGTAFALQVERWLYHLTRS